MEVGRCGDADGSTPRRGSGSSSGEGGGARTSVVCPTSSSAVEIESPSDVQLDRKPKETSRRIPAAEKALIDALFAVRRS